MALKKANFTNHRAAAVIMAASWLLGATITHAVML